MKLRQISYGTTSAVVTGMALVTGLSATSGSRASIVAGLLIFALADNLTDSLSIHIYQEAERLEERAALGATLSNFAARLTATLSFVLVVTFAPPWLAIPISVAWGLCLLSLLTILLARERGVPVIREIVWHLGLAMVVIGASRMIGTWLARAVD